jgi:hypothetical protein
MVTQFAHAGLNLWVLLLTAALNAWSARNAPKTSLVLTRDVKIPVLELAALMPGVRSSTIIPFARAMLDTLVIHLADVTGLKVS